MSDRDNPTVLPSGWRLRCQLPITLSTSEPEPDITLARGDRQAFLHRHPNATDFGIVIEVADSSLALDRGPKATLYAQAGIPIYWIINIPDRQIEVYANPNPTANPPASTARTDFGIGDVVPIVLDGVTVASLPVSESIP